MGASTNSPLQGGSSLVHSRNNNILENVGTVLLFHLSFWARHISFLSNHIHVVKILPICMHFTAAYIYFFLLYNLLVAYAYDCSGWQLSYRSKCIVLCWCQREQFYCNRLLYAIEKSWCKINLKHSRGYWFKTGRVDFKEHQFSCMLTRFSFIFIPGSTYMCPWLNWRLNIHHWLFVCFVALRFKSTAMVMAGRSVHLTSLFSWASLNQYFVHILSLVTDNNPSWMIQRKGGEWP